jgi:hypothetical protein
MRRECRSRILAAAILPSLLALPAAAHAATNPLRPLPVSDARVAELAREGAQRRLRSSECQKVLDDFADGEGRRLSERLRVFGVSPEEYLGMLPFLDGASRPLCESGQSQLLTTAGTARVLVCKPFLETVRDRRITAEVYVIHEMLHTLGLGENPPSSQEITQRVIRRCAP